MRFSDFLSKLDLPQQYMQIKKNQRKIIFRIVGTNFRKNLNLVLRLDISQF